MPSRSCVKRGSRAEWSILPGPTWVPWDQYALELGHQGWGGCVSEVRSTDATRKMRGNGPGDCAKSSTLLAEVLLAGTTGSGSALPAAGPAQPECPMIQHPTRCLGKHGKTSTGRHPSTHGTLGPYLCLGLGHGGLTCQSWAQGPAGWRMQPAAQLG